MNNSILVYCLNCTHVPCISKLIREICHFLKIVWNCFLWEKSVDLDYKYEWTEHEMNTRSYKPSNDLSILAISIHRSKITTKSYGKLCKCFTMLRYAVFKLFLKPAKLSSNYDCLKRQFWALMHTHQKLYPITDFLHPNFELLHTFQTWVESYPPHRGHHRKQGVLEL